MILQASLNLQADVKLSGKAVKRSEQGIGKSKLGNMDEGFTARILDSRY